MTFRPSLRESIDVTFMSILRTSLRARVLNVLAQDFIEIPTLGHQPPDHSSTVGARVAPSMDTQPSLLLGSLSFSPARKVPEVEIRKSLADPTTTPSTFLGESIKAMPHAWRAVANGS